MLASTDAGTSSTKLCLTRTRRLILGDRVVAVDGKPVKSEDDLQFGVHLDLDARRPAPLPDALRDKARALLATSDT